MENGVAPSFGTGWLCKTNGRLDGSRYKTLRVSRWHKNCPPVAQCCKDWLGANKVPFKAEKLFQEAPSQILSRIALLWLSKNNTSVVNTELYLPSYLVVVVVCLW